MTSPYTGGCACGAIRYAIAAEPVAMLDCQCRQCQRQTGGGHASYLTFSTPDRGIRGEPRTWQAVGDGGTVKHSAFCAACGSPLFITFPAMPDIIAVRAGILDEPQRHRPQFVTWHAAAHGWDHLDPALPVFATMPPR